MNRPGWRNPPGSRLPRRAGHRAGRPLVLLAKLAVLLGALLVGLRLALLVLGGAGHQGRVDGGAEPDLAAEHLAQRTLELGSQPALDLGAGELVGDRDDRQLVVDGDRIAADSHAR